MKSPEEFQKEVEKRADQAEAARAARKARFAAMTPNPKSHLVAWVDLLGFSHQLRSATSPEKFQAAYRRMLDVQAEFDKDTASVHPDQGELNAAQGKRIVALSDGLVIALDLEDQQQAGILTPIQRICWFLEELRLAHARCTVTGNFLRGGIALGQFWFEDDILLSPALAMAYEMESKKADKPVIILERELAKALQQWADEEREEDLIEDLFRDCDWMEDEEDHQKYVMIDFMQTVHQEHQPEIWLPRYHRTLEKCLAEAPDRAKAKYQWLMQHARAFVLSDYPDLSDNLFLESPTENSGKPESTSDDRSS